MKKPASKPAKKPVGRGVVSAKRAAAQKRKTSASIKLPASNKTPALKNPRAKITIEHPKNLVVSDDDTAAQKAVSRAVATSEASERSSDRRTAVDRADEPLPAPIGTLVERVSNTIERELSKIEIIIGDGERIPRLRRTEAESRARVLASLARTLKEVMRLREQQRSATRESMKAADDAIPRDLDTLRSELARRLAILVGEAAHLHPDAAD
jgi:hypothetical protein